MAIFSKVETHNIRRFAKDMGDRLYKAVPSDIGFRLSSIVKEAHSHRVTSDHINSDDMMIQAKQYRKAGNSLLALADKMMEEAYDMAKYPRPSVAHTKEYAPIEHKAAE